MKRFRISHILLLCVAAGLGTLLFWTSQSVQQAEDRLAQINRDIRSERESIRVLGAEWDYLNRPQRLEELANEYLTVSPPESGQFIESAGEIPAPLPGIIPPAKPAVVAQPVSTRTPTQTEPATKPAPPVTIKASEKDNFEQLIQRLGEGE